MLMKPTGVRLVSGQSFRILTAEKQAKLIISFSSLPKSVLEEVTEPIPATNLWHSFTYILYILFFQCLTNVLLKACIFIVLASLYG